MAVEVKIKSKGFFKKNLEFKDIIVDYMRYGIMDESYRLEEGKIGKYTVVFNKNKICRGHEISIGKGEVYLRLPLPTCEEDINFFYNHIKYICKKMNTNSLMIEEEKVSINDLDKYIKNDLETSKMALEKIKENIESNKYETMYIFGAINPIAIGQKETDEINCDPYKFGELLDNLQKMDVYYARAQVYKRKDESSFGVYILTENIPSVLPFKAQILMQKKDIEISDWNIGFVYDENIQGFIPYQDFLNNIEKDNVYDTEHFIATLNKKQIQKLLEKYKVEL